MDPYGEIQDALARQLDAVFGPVPVYFERVAQAGDDGEPELTGDYIFVAMRGTGLTTLGPQRTGLAVLVDIAMHKQGATYRAYRTLAMEIDTLIRPVFLFGDRAITVHEADFRVVDGVLHYVFTLRYLPETAIEQDAAAELMSELEAVIVTDKE